MIAISVKRLISFLLQWHLFLGRNPRQAPPFSVILFPAHTTVLCCGIAGILAVKSGPTPLAVDTGANLARHFAAIRKAPLSRVIAGRIKLEGYLAGVGPLTEMERDLVLLRQESPFQGLFFNPGKAAALQSLIPEMTTFLAGEEGLLEAEAGRFATAQMEIINSRLILLKDILWGLEKDILANVEKILHLAGAGRVEEITPESFVKYARVNFLLNCIDRLEVQGTGLCGAPVLAHAERPRNPGPHHRRAPGPGASRRLPPALRRARPAERVHPRGRPPPPRRRCLPLFRLQDGLHHRQARRERPQAPRGDPRGWHLPRLRPRGHDLGVDLRPHPLGLRGLHHRGELPPHQQLHPLPARTRRADSAGGPLFDPRVDRCDVRRRDRPRDEVLPCLRAGPLDDQRRPQRRHRQLPDAALAPRVGLRLRDRPRGHLGHEDHPPAGRALSRRRQEPRGGLPAGRE